MPLLIRRSARRKHARSNTKWAKFGDLPLDQTLPCGVLASEISACAQREVARSSDTRPSVATANTFEIVARQWHEKQAMASVIESLETNIFLDMGSRPIREVSVPELLATMRKVEKRGALDVAQRSGRVAARCFANYSG